MNNWPRPVPPPVPATPTPPRIPPAPFDSPPFPSGDWQIGGSQIIGDPGELAPYPLMQAIYERLGGQAWKDSKIQIYGWVNFSGNISTSHPSSTSQNGNFPLIYDLRPNRMELNQFVVYLERLADENQTDHVDWGFPNFNALRARLPVHDNLRVFSDQLLKHNSYAGFDMPMIYLDLYVPQIFQGMNIRIGRIISSRTSKRSWHRTISWPATRSFIASMTIVMKEFLRPRRLTISGQFRPA